MAAYRLIRVNPKSITDFSERYAGQNEQDHTAFVDAVKSGRLEAKMKPGRRMPASRRSPGAGVMEAPQTRL